jgi:hypothetical protein
MVSVASNPDAGRGRIEVLAEGIERSLSRPHFPAYMMDATAWATSILDEMPWLLPTDAAAAGERLAEKYWRAAPLPSAPEAKP